MYRYPGIHPFKTNQSHLFYGREAEIKELSRLIFLNRITLLFGKSGTGKTSLLKAGVCPTLEERFLHPVFIRLNNPDLSPLQQVYHALVAGQYIPETMPDNLHLWEYFEKFQFGYLGEVFTPVIIFDQFEEFFTFHTPDRQQAFLDQFENLVNNRMPTFMRRALSEPVEAGATPTSTANSYEGALSPIKFVISIRSDYLYLLNRLSDEIPGILRCRYELHSLTRESAQKAIVLPALFKDDLYECPPFKYSDQAKKNMLDELSKTSQANLKQNQQPTKQYIEAAHLQLLCQDIERKIIQQKIPAQPPFTVEPKFYGGSPGIKKILNDFYLNVLQKFEEPERIKVQRLVEEGLIRGKMRIMQEEQFICEGYDLKKEQLKILTDYRLLKKEAHRGAFYYEISHDTLVDPILKTYSARKEKEEEIAQRQMLYKERQRLYRALLVSVLSLIIVVGVAYYMHIQNVEAKANYLIANVNTILHRDQQNADAFHLLSSVYTQHKGGVSEPMAEAFFKAIQPDGQLISLRTFSKAHSGPITAIDISNDDRFFLTSSEDSTAVLWDLKQLKKIGTVNHKGSINDIRFAPDTSLFLTASDDSTATLWDTELNEVKAFPHQDEVHQSLFLGNQFIITAGGEGMIRIWDRQSYIPARSFQRQWPCFQAISIAGQASPPVACQRGGTRTLGNQRKINPLHSHQKESHFRVFS